MYTVLLILKNKVLRFNIYALLVFVFLLNSKIYSAGIQIPRIQTPVEPSPGMNRSPDRPASSQPGQGTTRTIEEYPKFIIGGSVSFNLIHISAHSKNTFPEWDLAELSFGGFFDMRLSKRFAVKFTYDFFLPGNISASGDTAKAINVIDMIIRYNLFMKHQVWIGFGVSFHFLDSFADPVLNSWSVYAGYITDKYQETTKGFIYFLAIYMGYYLEVTNTIVLDFTASYGLLHNNFNLWRYNIFRINVGVGFKL